MSYETNAYESVADIERRAEVRMQLAARDLYEALTMAEAHIRKVSGGGETDLRAILNAALAKASGAT